MRKSRTTSMRLNLKLLLSGLLLFVVVCCSSLVHANSLTATSPQEETINVPLTSWNELKGNLIQADALIRAQNYQRETGTRLSESIGINNRAGELIGNSLRIIERVESGTKE